MPTVIIIYFMSLVCSLTIMIAMELYTWKYITIGTLITMIGVSVIPLLNTIVVFVIPLTLVYEKHKNDIIWRIK